MTNGKTVMPPVNLQLTPQQAVVVAALERLMNYVGAELQQLDKLWGEKLQAAELAKVHAMLTAQRDSYVHGLSRIVTATAMPGIIQPG